MVESGLQRRSSGDLAHAHAAEHGRVRCGPFERCSGAVPWHAAGSPRQTDSLLTPNVTRFTIIFVPAGGPRTGQNNIDLTPLENRASHDRDPRRARAPRPPPLPSSPVPICSKSGMSPLGADEPIQRLRGRTIWKHLRIERRSRHAQVIPQHSLHHGAQIARRLQIAVLVQG